jgi:GNAT superfamily N-acetyltransferase
MVGPKRPGANVCWCLSHRLAAKENRSLRMIPTLDDRDVWAVWCLRVRPGHRGEGISHELLRGAVDFARDSGAPAIEGYPVDNRGEKVDLTMAFVGTRKLFEAGGFEKAADTTSTLDGFPRVLMRLELGG